MLRDYFRTFHVLTPYRSSKHISLQQLQIRPSITVTVISSFRFIFPQFTAPSIYFSFLLNSTNWHVPNVTWLFICQSGQSTAGSTYAVGMDSNPIEALQFFLGLICNCLNYHILLLWWTYYLRDLHNSSDDVKAKFNNVIVLLFIQNYIIPSLNKLKHAYLHRC